MIVTWKLVIIGVSIKIPPMWWSLAVDGVKYSIEKYMLDISPAALVTIYECVWFHTCCNTRIVTDSNEHVGRESIFPLKRFKCH